MEINTILNDLNTKTLNKYDDINKDYISSLDVNSIFKIESKIIDEWNILKEKEMEYFDLWAGNFTEKNDWIE